MPKNLTAVGALTAAGTATALETVLVKEVCIQLTPAAPPAVQVPVVPVMVEAVVGIVWAPEVNWVEVTVRFHPAAPPVVSLTEKGRVKVAVVPGVPVKV